MTTEQALEQIEIAYAALTELNKADWLHQVHHNVPVDLADAIHHTNEIWARLESFSQETSSHATTRLSRRDRPTSISITQPQSTD
ncbi:MAG: hypothetical protein RMZ41_003050 [Nostoc sp. DedVER02]